MLTTNNNDLTKQKKSKKKQKLIDKKKLRKKESHQNFCYYIFHYCGKTEVVTQLKLGQKQNSDKSN